MLYLFITIMVLASTSVSWAEEPMYKCEDGTFTNRVELLCQQYESQGKVLILTEGMSVASARSLVDHPSVVDQRTQKINLSDAADACNLYKEWIAMNLQTGGGVTFHLTQDVVRWVSLARIFPAGVPPPNCP